MSSELKPPQIQELSRGHKRFRVQFRRDGRKYDATFGTREEAQVYIDRYAGPAVSFATVANEYLASPTFRNTTENTKATYRSRLTPILEHFGDMPVAAIRVRHINEYLSKRAAFKTRLGRGVAGDTQNLERTVINNVLALAVRHEYILHNPCHDADRAKTNTRKVRVSADELNQLLRLAHGKVAYDAKGQPIKLSPRQVEAGRFLYVLAETGGRASELAGLKLEHLDLAANRIWLPQTKAGKAQYRYFSPVGAELVRQQIAALDGEGRKATASGLLFPSRNGTPHSYQYSVAIAKELGLVSAEFHAHATRREFISFAKESGADTFDVMRMTGLSSPALVERYAETAGETEEEAGRRQALQNARLERQAQAMRDDIAKRRLENVLTEQKLAGAEIAAVAAEAGMQFNASALDPALELRRALASGELSRDDVLRLLLEVPAAPASK